MKQLNLCRDARRFGAIPMIALALAACVGEAGARRYLVVVPGTPGQLGAAVQEQVL